MIEYEYRKTRYKVPEKYNGIFKAYANISSAEELRKNRLHLSSYHHIPEMLHELSQEGKTKTFISELSEWFRKQGCRISMVDEINYLIEY